MANQFLSFDFKFIRSPEFKTIKPSTLKVYFYLKSRILRSKEVPLYREGKLACRISRRKIQADTGLTPFQVRKVIEDFKNYGIKVTRTGRACYFILGEWKTIKSSNDAKQYVENFCLEELFIHRLA